MGLNHSSMRYRLAALSAALVSGVTGPAGAQQAGDPLVTDRPDFTESALAVAPGVVQLELGYTLTRGGAVNTHTLGEVLLRIGIVPRAELRVGLNSFAWDDDPLGDNTGLEDASVGLKVELANGGGALGFDLLKPRVALLLSTTIPTGGAAFGEEDLRPGAVLALSWDVSERVGLGANANVAAASEAGDRYGQFSGAVSVGVSLTERVGAYGEYFMFAPSGPGDDATGFLNGGFTFLVSNDFQFDARAGIGLYGTDTDLFVGAGLARRF